MNCDLVKTRRFWPVCSFGTKVGLSSVSRSLCLSLSCFRSEKELLLAKVTIERFADFVSERIWPEQRGCKGVSKLGLSYWGLLPSTTPDWLWRSDCRQRRERKWVVLRLQEVDETRKFLDSSQLHKCGAKVKLTSCEKTCWNAVRGFLDNLCGFFCWQGRRVVLLSRGAKTDRFGPGCGGMGNRKSWCSWNAHCFMLVLTGVCINIVVRSAIQWKFGKSGASVEPARQQVPPVGSSCFSCQNCDFGNMAVPRSLVK